MKIVKKDRSFHKTSFQQFPVFYAHNVPYTFIDKMGPHTDFENMDYKMVYYNMMEDKPYNRVSIIIPSYLNNSSFSKIEYDSNH